MADYQKYPITDPSSNIRTGNASVGIFVCDASNPFDYSLLTGRNKGKMGNAVQLVTRDGSAPSVASATLNGVTGNSNFLIGSWASGQGFGVEIEELTMANGYAIIYLKDITE